MYRILSKKQLNPTVTQMEILSEPIAKKAQPGQFVILRVSESGERIPLTIAGADAKTGAVKIIFQIVGATTKALDQKQCGEYISDIVGPLGNPTKLDGLKKVCVVAGGVGCAIAMPIAQALHERGSHVCGIIGFRTKDLVILENEFEQCCDELFVMTDDGSYGERGNVTMPLKRLLEGGERFDEIITIGPLIMMKFTTETSRPYGIPVTVSMNPIMIDGTGMCGGCRLTLNRNGERITKFACVDGPDFNGYEIDFDEAMARGRMYGDFERHAYEASCNLFKNSADNDGKGDA